MTFWTQQVLLKRFFHCRSSMTSSHRLLSCHHRRRPCLVHLAWKMPLLTPLQSHLWAWGTVIVTLMTLPRPLLPVFQLMLTVSRYTPCLKITGPLWYSTTTLLYQHVYWWFFAKRISIQLFITYVWKVWYWSRTTCVVSIETVAPLQTAAKCEQSKFCWMKVVGLFWLKICIVKRVMVLGNWWRNFQIKPGRQSCWIPWTDWRKLETTDRSWQDEVVTRLNSDKQLLSKFPVMRRCLRFPCPLISTQVVFIPHVESSNATLSLTVFVTHGRCQ